MASEGSSPQHWLTSRLVRLTAAQRALILSGTVLICLLWLGFVYLAARHDHTLILPRDGRGFFQHRGYIVLHLTTPFALIFALLALLRFTSLASELDQFILPGDDSWRDTIVRTHLDSLNLRTRWRYMLLLFVLVGALSSTAVLLQVRDPVSTYGHDVFNATRHPWGYYVANTYLGVAWTFVYPVSLFYVLHITVSVLMILTQARRRTRLRVDLFHPDNCGGLSSFGALNLLLMVYYVPPFLAILGLAETHSRGYASLLIPAILLSFVFMVQSVLGVRAITLAVRAEKAARLASLAAVLGTSLDKPTATSGAALALWQHIRGVRTMPYASNVQTLVNVLRYVPPTVPFLKLLLARTP